MSQCKFSLGNSRNNMIYLSIYKLTCTGSSTKIHNCIKTLLIKCMIFHVSVLIEKLMNNQITMLYINLKFYSINPIFMTL